MPLNWREQRLADLIRRARNDPVTEAARFGIGLDDGLVGVAIDPRPHPPLALSEPLCRAAARHSADLLTHGLVDHAGSGGTTPADRAFAAGWQPLPGAAWMVAENVSSDFREGDAPDPAAVIDAHHRGLFLSPAHRWNMFAAATELGVGQATGPTRTATMAWPHASIVTVIFADGGRR